jgi:organic radical activating enzyme
MNYNPDTFCSAAWFGLRNEQFGQFRVCSKIDIECSNFDGITDHAWPQHTAEQFVNSDYAQYVRKNLTQGQCLPECHRCWTSEKLGLPSARIVSNHTVTNNSGQDLSRTWVHSYMSRKQDYVQDHLIAADVKLTNTCNFACAMCNPADSSRIYAVWAGNVQHPVVQLHLEKNPDYLDQVRASFVDKNNHQLLAELLTKRPRHIKLLGGEPLLDQTVLNMLCESQHASTTRLSFVTNGSVDLLATTQRLHNFQSVHYTVSLEGVGAVQDYLRRGSNWQQIAHNIEQFCHKFPDHINIHVTVQALNLAHLPKLLDWCQARDLPITFGMVEDPAYLSVAAIPHQLRDADHLAPYQTQTKGLMEHVLNIPHQPILMAQLKQFVDWFDPDQHWISVVPEWNGWLN